jgi:hypothetical protein
VWLILALLVGAVSPAERELARIASPPATGDCIASPAARGDCIASPVATGDHIASPVATGDRIGFPAAGGDGIALTVEVSRTIDRAVGNATGWFCDDPSLVDASIVTREDVNYWVVAGVKVGSTQCRVGTDPSRASFVFDVTVKRSSSKRRR